jgi:hypothetical protein
MVGGGLMFAVGALYLIAEKSILADATSRNDSADATINLNSRLILGTQVSCDFEILQTELTVPSLALYSFP